MESKVDLKKVIIVDTQGSLIKYNYVRGKKTDIMDYSFIDGILPKLRSFYHDGYNIFIYSATSQLTTGVYTPTEYMRFLKRLVSDINIYCTAEDHGYFSYDPSKIQDLPVLDAMTVDGKEHHGSHKTYRKVNASNELLERLNSWNVDIKSSFMVSSKIGHKANSTAGVASHREHSDMKLAHKLKISPISTTQFTSLSIEYIYNYINVFEFTEKNDILNQL